MTQCAFFVFKCFVTERGFQKKLLDTFDAPRTENFLLMGDVGTPEGDVSASCSFALAHSRLAEWGVYHSLYTYHSVTYHLP